MDKKIIGLVLAVAITSSSLQHASSTRFVVATGAAVAAASGLAGYRVWYDAWMKKPVEEMRKYAQSELSSIEYKIEASKKARAKFKELYKRYHELRDVVLAELDEHMSEALKEMNPKKNIGEIYGRYKAVKGCALDELYEQYKESKAALITEILKEQGNEQLSKALEKLRSATQGDPIALEEYRRHYAHANALGWGGAWALVGAAIRLGVWCDWAK